MHHLIENIVQDLRFAGRQLRRSPGFTITAVLTIALGIGANTAIFTLAHGVLLRELPVQDPRNLYSIGDARDCCISGGMPAGQQYSIFSLEAYQQLRKSLPEFSELAAMPANSNNGPHTARREGQGGAAQNLHSSYVSGNYFSLFGLAAARGRLLTKADDQESAPPVAVMSYPTWQNQFQSDPTVVGATFLLDSKPVTVVGIAPASFYGDRVSPRARDFYVPIAAEPKLSDTPINKNPHLRSLYLMGRVKPGVDLHVLQQKIDNVLRTYLATTPDYKSAEAMQDLPRIHAPLIAAAIGIPQLQKQVSKGIQLLLSIAVLVLLIACANVANLMLARAMTRRTETGVRVALGAAQSRIVRQSLTECLLLAFLASALGIALAYGGARAMLDLAFTNVRNLPISAAPSLPVLAFTLGTAVATGLLFGIAPAWSSSQSQPADALRGSNRSNTGRASAGQRALVVLQATLSVVLITVAALLTRSLLNLEHQNFGLQTGNRMVLQLDPAASGYTPGRYPGLIRSLRARISSIPGTASVAFAQYSPLEGESWGENIVVEGRPDPTPHQDTGAVWDRVSPGFFQTVGQPLLRGRDFTEADRADTPLAAIVNEKFVRKFFPNEDPLGKRFGSEPHKFDYTIVGVVADAKFQSPSQDVDPMYFRSMLQPNLHADPKDIGETVSLAPHAVLVHTTGAQANYEADLRHAVADVDSNLAILDLRSLDSQIAGLLNDQRMIARLTAAFGILALVLASVGLYGVTAYSVAQRVPEMGLRIALGAGRLGVMHLILRSALTHTLAGLALGIPLALLAGHALEAQLFGIRGHDAATLAATCLLLALSAVVAATVPAHRASSVDPMQALRNE